jgi:hypothetical protein
MPSGLRLRGEQWRWNPCLTLAASGATLVNNDQAED